MRAGGETLDRSPSAAARQRPPVGERREVAAGGGGDGLEGWGANYHPAPLPARSCGAIGHRTEPTPGDCLLYCPAVFLGSY